MRASGQPWPMCRHPPVQLTKPLLTRIDRSREQPLDPRSTRCGSRPWRRGRAWITGRVDHTLSDSPTSLGYPAPVANLPGPRAAHLRHDHHYRQPCPDPVDTTWTTVSARHNQSGTPANPQVDNAVPAWCLTGLPFLLPLEGLVEISPQVPMGSGGLQIFSPTGMRVGRSTLGRRGRSATSLTVGADVMWRTLSRRRGRSVEPADAGSARGMRGWKGRIKGHLRAWRNAGHAVTWNLCAARDSNPEPADFELSLITACRGWAKALTGKGFVGGLVHIGSHRSPSSCAD